MILSIEDINKIMENESRLRSHLDKSQYIKDCYEIIGNRISEYFTNSNLYQRAYYKNTSSGTLDYVDINTDQTAFTDASIKAYIDKVSILANQGKTISFTELMSTHNKQVLCLYKKSISNNLINKNSTDHFLMQSLADIDAKLKVANFFNEAPSKIEQLLDIYTEITKIESVSDCFIYFIRPFTRYETYNGIFSIILSRELSAEEIQELSFIWTKVLADTSILEIKEKEQNYIFEEHTHTWNSELNALNQHLDVINKRFLEHDLFNMDRVSIRQNINYAVIKATLLRDVAQFHLFLMKTKGYNSWEDVLKNAKSEQDQILIERMKPENYKLCDILIEALQTLLIILESNKKVEKYFEEKKELIKGIICKLSKMVAIEIFTIKIGAYIIFFELLRNGLYHMDFESVEFSVEVENKSNEIVIQFINGGAMPAEAVNNINSANPDDSSFKRKGGLRTVKRIVSSPLLTKSNKKWSLEAYIPLSTENKSINIITIPK